MHPSANFREWTWTTIAAIWCGVAGISTVLLAAQIAVKRRFFVLVPRLSAWRTVNWLLGELWSHARIAFVAVAILPTLALALTLYWFLSAHLLQRR